MFLAGAFSAFHLFDNADYEPGTTSARAIGPQFRTMGWVDSPLQQVGKEKPAAPVISIPGSVKRLSPHEHYSRRMPKQNTASVLSG
jgi:hypothetical protein